MRHYQPRRRQLCHRITTPWRGRLLAQLLLSLVAALALAARVCAAQQPAAAVLINITSGQQLANAVADFGVSGADTTLVLPPGLTSLANATFTAPVPNLTPSAANSSARQPFSSGRLTMLGSTARSRAAGSGGPASVVLDAGMRVGVSGSFSGSGKSERRATLKSQ